MAGSQFFNMIHTAAEEREVDRVYTIGLNKYFPNIEITHPYKCDSYIETTTSNKKMLHLLVEYKYDENLRVPAGWAKVLIQVIFYMKRFEIDGRILPNVILVGDINECFVLQSNVLIPYLDYENVDWTVAPSEAHTHFPDMVLNIANDEKIAPFVYDVDENFSFKNVYEDIVAQADNVRRQVHMTEHNIANIFDYFCNRILKDSKKIEPLNLVNIFIHTLTDPDNYYQHPKNPNKLIAGQDKYDIIGNAFTAFISVFDRDYCRKERRRFSEISDRLIEDTTRRRNGEFYTPTPFVDYAHKMLSEELGEDWREKYIVWDCCWGTGNLTRDYRFNELYASTLVQSELDLGERYNHEAEKFVFDFLNDPIEDVFGTHVPEGLLSALKENKPLLFFINPPYANNTGDGKLAGASEKVCYTSVRNSMNQVGLEACVANLYAQFIYRILMLKDEYGLTNLALGLYSPTLFLTGISWSTFRKVLFHKLEYKQGIIFKASNFADVSDSWGISFTVWNTGTTENKNSFEMLLVDDIEGNIVPISNKTLYNIDSGKTASSWVREETKGIKTYDSINLTSAIKVREKDGQRKGMIIKSALGYFYNAGNNIDKNVSHIALFSAACSLGIGNSVIPQNIHKCSTLFSARKLISKNWINSKDEYLAPNEGHPLWREFVGDSLIYSLFHTSSNQSSLRNVEYKGKEWNIPNEFFFMSCDEILDLAEMNKVTYTEDDADTDKDRFVYLLLEHIEGRGTDTFAKTLPEGLINSLPTGLSPEARTVLDKAREICRKTFKYRKLFDQAHPEYQILNWDCGWYQLKALAKESAPKDLEEFITQYNKLSNKMRPMVYLLGFLK